MSKLRTITPQSARRLAISRQRLVDPRPAPTRQGIIKLFQDIGCVQIDPLRAVERTQLLVLWSRLGRFDPADLEALLTSERRLFEYWAHAASIVMMDDYPLYQVHMRHWLVGDEAWQKRTLVWLEENDELRRTILSTLGQNGPLSSRDFKDNSQKSWESSGWTSGQNVGLMLNSLWRLGQIMVNHRQGLNKYWDLSARVLPAWAPRQEMAWPEAVYQAAQRSLRALGVARPGDIEQHFTRQRYHGLSDTLDRLEAQALVFPIEIIDQGQTWPGRWLIHAADLPLLDQIEAGDWQPRTTLLSPFDNLICDRDRSELLFDFHFRIEIYVPAAKRQYGYYVMPILHGDRLIGRIDPKMDRKKKQLQVNALYSEPGFVPDVETTWAVAQAIEDLATFLGAKDVEYSNKAIAAWPGIR